MPLPNFLIVGAQKAGTTSLYHYLGSHPDVFMSSVKEPAYFVYNDQGVKYLDIDGKPWRNQYRDLKKYRELFRDVRSESAIGEASTIYLYHPDAPRRIQRLLPDVRLIAILRNPVERAYSNFRFARMQGREPIDNFREALEAEDDRVEKGWAPLWHYKAKGYYANQLERYYSVFPGDQIFVCLFDDLKKDSKLLLRRISMFLRVDPHFSIDLDKRYNESVLPRRVEILQALRRNRFLTTFVSKAIPRAVRTRLRRHVFGGQPEEVPPLSDGDKDYLADIYGGEIERLKVLLGRELRSWKLD